MSAIMPSTQKKSKKLTDKELAMFSVPPIYYQYYSVNSIVNIGAKIKKNYYILDQFIFKIEHNKITNAYYNAQYLIDNSHKLP